VRQLIEGDVVEGRDVAKHVHDRAASCDGLDVAYPFVVDVDSPKQWICGAA
jgi:hypothetical protein